MDLKRRRRRIWIGPEGTDRHLLNCNLMAEVKIYVEDFYSNIQIDKGDSQSVLSHIVRIPSYWHLIFSRFLPQNDERSPLLFLFLHKIRIFLDFFNYSYFFFFSQKFHPE
jgi:hypothetical protein